MAFPEPGVLGASDVTRGEFRTAIEDFLAATVAGVAAHGRQAFTADGTFTVPAGVTQIWARVVGGGGGGGGSWSSPNGNTAADGIGGGTSSIARSGSTLVFSYGGQSGKKATSAGAGARGNYAHLQGSGFENQSAGNCSLLRPYGKGGIGGGVINTGYSGGGGGASEGAFALLSVSADQVLTITVGAGGGGGAGSTPNGAPGDDGNSGAVLLEW